MFLSFSLAFTKARAAALDWSEPRGKLAGVDVGGELSVTL